MGKRTGWRKLAGLLVAVSLSLATGCQTWIGGMTLPSPDYLKDNPDYIPKPPKFPLPRELSAMQAAQAAAAGGAAAPAGAPAP